MDPHAQFCHNRRCRAYGRSGEGHLVIHSQKERRYRCKRCGRTFTETKDTAFYRMHKPRWLVLGSHDVAFLRLSGAGYRRRLRSG